MSTSVREELLSSVMAVRADSAWAPTAGCSFALTCGISLASALAREESLVIAVAADNASAMTADCSSAPRWGTVRLARLRESPRV